MQHVQKGDSRLNLPPNLTPAELDLLRKQIEAQASRNQDQGQVGVSPETSQPIEFVPSIPSDKEGGSQPPAVNLKTKEAITQAPEGVSPELLNELELKGGTPADRLNTLMQALHSGKDEKGKELNPHDLANLVNGSEKE